MTWCLCDGDPAGLSSHALERAILTLRGEKERLRLCYCANYAVIYSPPTGRSSRAARASGTRFEKHHTHWAFLPSAHDGRETVNSSRRFLSVGHERVPGRGRGAAA